MIKILIIYFSGAGATKKLSEEMYNILSENDLVDIFPIEGIGNVRLEDYDALIIGTPVYHGEPSKIIMNFIREYKSLMKPIPSFIFNTRALWSCNTNRILAKLLQEKNIITIMDRNYRSPASDGVLIAPFVKRFFMFEKDIVEKIKTDCNLFIKKLRSGNIKGYIPYFRFSSMINAPNSWIGQHTTFNIYVHQQSCIKCNKCIINCPHEALCKATSGYPEFIKENCENCYRCIHHCPKMALSLSKKRAPKKLLDYSEK